MCNILNIREVEEIVIGADLKLVLSFAQGCDHLGENLNVAFAKDACRSDGACQEVRGGAVGLEYCDLGVCLLDVLISDQLEVWIAPS